MTLLWAILAVMTLVGVAVIVLPILRFREIPELSPELVNSAVFRDRLRELEQDLSQQQITDAEFEQLKQELQLALLDDVKHAQASTSVLSMNGKALVIPLLIIIPVLSFGVYWSEGYRPELSDWFDKQEKMKVVLPLMMAGDFDAAEKYDVGLDDFVRALQKQVQATPDNAQTWYLLGVSYMQMRMAEQGELAFSRALSIEPRNTDYLMGYTQASLALSDGALTPQIQRTLENLIQQQPDNPKPYMTWGMAYFQQGDYASAIGIWERYLSLPTKDEKAADLLNRSIDVARNELQISNESPAPGGAEKPAIAVTVTIDDAVKSQLQPTDVLFVYAKAVSGPPMPLAVVRQVVSTWPVHVVLSEDNAMTPAMTIAKYKQVVVQARISPSGNAIPQSGDWMGPTQVIDIQPGTQAVDLSINFQMP